MPGPCRPAAAPQTAWNRRAWRNGAARPARCPHGRSRPRCPYRRSRPCCLRRSQPPPRRRGVLFPPGLLRCSRPAWFPRRSPGRAAASCVRQRMRGECRTCQHSTGRHPRRRRRRRNLRDQGPHRCCQGSGRRPALQPRSCRIRSPHPATQVRVHRPSRRSRTRCPCPVPNPSGQTASRCPPPRNRPLRTMVQPGGAFQHRCLPRKIRLRPRLGPICVQHDRCCGQRLIATRQGAIRPTRGASRACRPLPLLAFPWRAPPRSHSRSRKCRRAPRRPRPDHLTVACRSRRRRRTRPFRPRRNRWFRWLPAPSAGAPPCRLQDPGRGRSPMPGRWMRLRARPFRAMSSRLHRQPRSRPQWRPRSSPAHPWHP
jgi:hypothetical protein